MDRSSFTERLFEDYLASCRCEYDAVSLQGAKCRGSCLLQASDEYDADQRWKKEVVREFHSVASPGNKSLTLLKEPLINPGDGLQGRAISASYYLTTPDP